MLDFWVANACGAASQSIRTCPDILCIPAASAPAAGAASAPAPGRAPSARGGPPPPPPPKPPGGPGSLLERPAAGGAKPAAPAGPNMNALFAELSKVRRTPTRLCRLCDPRDRHRCQAGLRVVPASQAGQSIKSTQTTKVE